MLMPLDASEIRGATVPPGDTTPATTSPSASPSQRLDAPLVSTESLRLAHVQDRLDALISARAPLSAAAAEVAGVAGDDRLDAAERVAIYGEMFRLRMYDALAEDFPAVRAAVGEPRFAGLCATYVAAHPSRSASLGDLGGSFGDFLDGQAGATDLPPWLVDLARLEWALVVAFTAPGGSVITREDLQRLAPEQWPALKLRPVASWLRCDSEYDVESLRDRLLVEAPAGALPENLRIPAGEFAQPVALRIWRKRQRVFLRRLNPLEAAALSRIYDGCRFDDLAEWLADRTAPERASEEALDLLLRWVDDEFLAAPSAAPES